MNKSMIKKVNYCFERKILLVEFKDGSGYGEAGKIAQRTFEQLNKDDVEVVNVPEIKAICNKITVKKIIS